MTMDTNESMAEANRILHAAGWTPPAGWDGFCHGTVIAGWAPNGQGAIKNWAAIREGHPQWGPDTPDEPHEAAVWLVKQYPNPLASEATLEPVRVVGLAEDGPAPEMDGIAAELSEDAGGGGTVHPTAPDAADPSPASPPEAQEPLAESSGSTIDLALDPIDADFTDESYIASVEAEQRQLGAPEPFIAEPEILEGEAPEDPALLEGPDFGDEMLEAEQEAAGPIAYAASDFDALVREKTGRVSQIARELKALLHEGWTIEEFRHLQGLIVRIERNEAPDDLEARARFQAISEKSQAMSRVDLHRDALEADLEAIGKRRDYAAAVEFDPEAGWPGQVQ